MDTTVTEAIYPRLLRRVRAILIDSVILVGILVFWWITLPLVAEFHPVLKIVPPLLLVFLFEPVMVATTGGTPGHHMMGIKVQGLKTAEYIGIVRAAIRMLLRGLFGWLSFVFVLTSKKHQAIHDLIAGTVVVLKTPEQVPDTERLFERSQVNDGYSYPAVWKRILMIVIYNIAGLVLLSILNMALLSGSCINYNQCTKVDFILSLFTNLIWLVCLGASIVMCWRGRLPGCRRFKLNEDIYL